MSNGLYALVGVVLGGALTTVSQIGVALVLARRAEKREWKVAARLVSDELARMDVRLEGPDRTS